MKSFFIGMVALLTMSCVAQSLASSAQQSRIAFFSIRDGNADIYTMNADGSDVRRLTHHAEMDTEPDWSPDGRYLSFVSRRDGRSEIYLIRPDGTGLRRLTDNDVEERSPKWSPDGAKIAYFAQHEGKQVVFVINADGTGETAITSRNRDHLSPAWSPDGQWIATEGAANDRHWVGPELPRRNQIWIQRADGSELRQVTAMDTYNGYPAWSPDGKRIAFDSNVEGYDPANTDFDIYVIDVDGTGAIKLTEGQQNTFADWSADGTRIAFVTNRDGHNQIYTMKPDGSDQIRLTQDNFENLGPSWSPW